MNFYNPLTAVKPQTIEGHTGVNALVYLPFSGYWSPSGKEYTFASGELIQRGSRPLLGLSRPDTFRKDCCGCGQAQTALV